MKSLRRSLNNSNHHHHGHGSGSGHGHGSSHSHSNSQGNSIPNATLGYSHGTGHGHGGSGGSAGLVGGPVAGGGPALSRPTEKVAPPQKVIKALNSHRSTNPQELSYTKGDFWYVTGEREGWYEALNPLTSSRGLVPKDDFEEFVKGGRQASAQHSPPAQHSRTMSHSQNSNGPRSPTLQMHTPPTPPSAMVGGASSGGHQMGSMGGSSTGSTGGGAGGMGALAGMGGMSVGLGGKKHQPLYAIVQYDFHAERPDELEAKAGEPIVVIAQSNHEWFVAKPIGRLGGPGLIPVAFVEIRDPVTGKPVDVFPSTIPQVEEWKKATAEYKAAAIPLGRLDLPPDQRVTNSPFQAASHTAPSSSVGHGDPEDLSASVTSSANATAKGTRRSRSPSKANGGAGYTHGSLGGSNASHQGYKPEQDNMLPPGELIELGVPSFHNESGNYWFRLHAAFLPDNTAEPAYTLILYRTYEDFYDFQISLLDTFPAEAGRPSTEGEEPPERMLPYMPGPVDEAIDDELTEYRRSELDAYVHALLELREKGVGYILRDELIRTFFAAKYGDYCEEMPRPDAVDELNARMEAVNLKNAAQIVPGQHARNAPDHSGGGNGWTFPTQGGGGNGAAHEPSGARTHQGHTRNMSSMANNNAHHQWNPSYGGNPNLSAVTPILPSSGTQLPPPHAAPAAAAPRAPPSNAAFVKIKIYDRATDDLIALRVHPAVTYGELLDKVRARLGPEIAVLQYRVGGGGPAANPAAPCRQIRNDRDLADWMASEDQRLVLYAEKQAR